MIRFLQALCPSNYKFLYSHYSISDSQANISEFMPFLSFGIMAAVAGVLVLFLPETNQNPLSDTIEEVKNIGKTPDPKN